MKNINTKACARRNRLRRWLRKLIATGAITLSASASAAGQDARVNSVLSVDQANVISVSVAGWPSNISVVVADINAPQTSSRCDQLAQRVAENRLAQRARNFVALKLSEAQDIELVNVRPGQYLRTTADVLVDGESLAQMLVEKGLAAPGTNGAHWCALPSLSLNA